MKDKLTVLKGLDHFHGGFELDVFKFRQPNSINLHAHDFNELVFTAEGNAFHKTLKDKKSIKRG